MIIAQTSDGGSYEIVADDINSVFNCLEDDENKYVEVKSLCNYLTLQNKLEYSRVYGVKPKDTFIQIDDIIRIDEVDISVSDE